MINIPNPSIPINTNLSNTLENSFLNLCTLNIQDLNDPMKQTQLINYLKS